MAAELSKSFQIIYCRYDMQIHPGREYSVAMIYNTT